MTTANVTSENRYLTEEEMQGNAIYISKVLLDNGWTLSAVAAILGNMESESTINPGIYENFETSSLTNGFGLVQWTPNTKYKEWADENGYGGTNALDYGDIDGQIFRILYEVENGLQWIETDEYPLSFVDFTTSTLDTEYLAQAFLYNYERPEDLNQPNRSEQARYWYTYLSNENITPTPKPIKTGISKLLYYYMALKR